MTIEVVCQRCEQRFEPTSEAIRKGPDHWMTCPACRQQQIDQDAAVIARRLAVARQTAPEAA